MDGKPRRRVQKDFDPAQGRVHQSFKDESDINVIMSRWRKTGILPPGESRTPMYGDFTNADDYLTAANKVRAAEESFAALPSVIRNRFDNDPSKLLAFMDDENNRSEAIEMGVIADPEAPSEPESPPPAEGEEVPSE